MIKLKKALNFIDLAQKGTFCLLRAVFKAKNCFPEIEAGNLVADFIYREHSRSQATFL